MRKFFLATLLSVCFFAHGQAASFESPKMLTYRFESKYGDKFVFFMNLTKEEGGSYRGFFIGKGTEHFSGEFRWYQLDGDLVKIRFVGDDGRGEFVMYVAHDKVMLVVDGESIIGEMGAL